MTERVNQSERLYCLLNSYGFRTIFTFIIIAEESTGCCLLDVLIVCGVYVVSHVVLFITHTHP